MRRNGIFSFFSCSCDFSIDLLRALFDCAESSVGVATPRLIKQPPHFPGFATSRNIQQHEPELKKLRKWDGHDCCLG